MRRVGEDGSVPPLDDRATVVLPCRLRDDGAVAVTRAERQAMRAPAVQAMFGREDARVVLELLEVLEIAWHDAYGDIGPPDRVVTDVLVCSRGELRTLIHAVWSAVTDWRDVRLWADDVRGTAQ